MYFKLLEDNSVPEYVCVFILLFYGHGVICSGRTLCIKNILRTNDIATVGKKRKQIIQTISREGICF